MPLKILIYGGNMGEHYFEGMNEGEILLYNECKKLESDVFKIIPNAMFERLGEGTNQIDLMAITKKGIFVFEMKDYKGWIFGDENHTYWTQSLNGGRGGSNKYKFRNPVKQNENHIKTVKGLLRKEGFDGLTIHNVVVFGDRAVLKSIDSSGDVVNLSDVRNVFDKYRDVMITKEEISNIYNYFIGINIKDSEIREKHLEFIRGIKKGNVKLDEGFNRNESVSRARENEINRTVTVQEKKGLFEKNKMLILGLLAMIAVLFTDKGYLLAGSIMLIIAGIKLKDSKAIKGAILLGVAYLMIGPIFGHTETLKSPEEPISSAVVVNESVDKIETNTAADTVKTDIAVIPEGTSGNIGKPEAEVIQEVNATESVPVVIDNPAEVVENIVETESDDTIALAQNEESILLGSDENTVKEFLGEPDNVENIGTSVVWKYSLGYVRFDQEMKVNGWKNYNGQLNAALRIPEENADSIDLGSTTEEVLKVLGSPDKIDSNNKYRWNYSLGYVNFDHDWGVNGWKNYNGQLNAALRTPEENAEAIDLGSTTEEVLKVLGSPDQIDPNNSYKWYYSLGYVSFDHDWKVNGWKNYNDVLTGKVVGE